MHLHLFGMAYSLTKVKAFGLFRCAFRVTHVCKYIHTVGKVLTANY